MGVGTERKDCIDLLNCSGVSFPAACGVNLYSRPKDAVMRRGNTPPLGVRFIVVISYFLCFFGYEPSKGTNGAAAASWSASRVGLSSVPLVMLAFAHGACRAGLASTVPPAKTETSAETLPRNAAQSSMSRRRLMNRSPRA